MFTDSSDIFLDLPYITKDYPGIGGKIRQKTSHFTVEEIPLYTPSGIGKHLYLNITKENITTREVQLKLAELFNLRPEEIGKAGLKDKFATTTQNFSVLFEGDQPSPNKIKKIVEEEIQVKVNWAKYHNNKLRAGHLKGNRFKIIITEIEKDANEKAMKILNRINQVGVPNYYGIQRIGEKGGNVIQGWLILKGKKRLQNKWLRKYLLSSYQSYLCNLYLTERVERGLFNTLLYGDLAKKHDTGGIFLVDNLYIEQERFDNKEISFTAPMFGYKMRETKHHSHELEKLILDRASLNMLDFRKNRVKGTRRIGRIIPTIKMKEKSIGIELVFSLPKGSFATIVLREFMKNDLFIN